MPILSYRELKPFPLLWGPHLQTIVPSIFRTVQLSYARERIITPDGDFLDLDWYPARPNDTHGNSQTLSLAIIFHGLEGSSKSAYVQAMARALAAVGFTALAVNHRGCSGVPNKLLRSYHSGATEDLAAVVEHVLTTYPHAQISLIGFSLSGNIILKYLGEYAEHLPPQLHKAVAISPPCDLQGSANKLARPINVIYMKYFLNKLRPKMLHKAKIFPGMLDITGIEQMKTFKEFDDAFTAPLHGFRDAQDYWTRCSAKSQLGKINIKTLIISAINDPFLSKDCYPVAEAQQNPHLLLALPENGGHNGFMERSLNGIYWSEELCQGFLTST